MFKTVMQIMARIISFLAPIRADPFFTAVATNVHTGLQQFRRDRETKPTSCGKEGFPPVTKGSRSLRQEILLGAPASRPRGVERVWQVVCERERVAEEDGRENWSILFG